MPQIAKIKRRLAKYLYLMRPLVYVSGALLLLLLLFLAGRKLLPMVKSAPLASFRGRSNFLLLGIGGGNHEGADLTDSIMLVSVNLSTGDTVIVSVPRDIWIDSLQAKVNTAYHYGEDKQPGGGGLIMAKSAVSEIVDQPVHYALVLDFSGFEEAINIIGGIDVDVPHGFVDRQYPIAGKEDAEPESARYETIEFAEGKQHFDGATALKYVRSRHGEGVEGTDYARAQRQQRVILAFKDKLLQAGTFLNLTKMKQLKEVLQDSIATDVPANVYPDLIKLALKIKRDEIRTGVLDQGSPSEDIPALLYNPPVSQFGQWVLLPAGNDWGPVHQYIEEILYQNQSAVSKMQ